MSAPATRSAPAYLDADEALACPDCLDEREGDEIHGVDADELADRRWPEPDDPGYPGPVRVCCTYCGGQLA